MTGPPSATPVLVRALTAVEPYLSELVLIGGWVPHVYRAVGGFSRWEGALSLTTEADLLIDATVHEQGRPSLVDLLRHAGFEPTTDGPSAAIWETTDPEPLRIEFLVQHLGPEASRRQLRAVATQRGIGAIPLTDLTVLSRFVRELSLPRLEPGASPTIVVRVPTLGAYVVNKAATFAQRPRAADGSHALAGKDLVYLRDLIAAGPDVRAQIAADLAVIVQDKSVLATTRTACRAVQNLQTHWPAAAIDAAVRELAARDQVSDHDVARADLLGSLGALGDIFDALG
jgi:hypothetical protein